MIHKTIDHWYVPLICSICLRHLLVLLCPFVTYRPTLNTRKTTDGTRWTWMAILPQHHWFSVSRFIDYFSSFCALSFVLLVIRFTSSDKPFVSFNFYYYYWIVTSTGRLLVREGTVRHCLLNIQCIYLLFLDNVIIIKAPSVICDLSRLFK